jgi:hypothetical protein
MCSRCRRWATQPLDDLADQLGGAWTPHLATAEGDQHPIRVEFLSKLSIDDSTEFWEFPAKLAPVQIDDTKPPVKRMGRAAFRPRSWRNSSRAP